MSTTMRFQASHSRNSHDWDMKRTKTGRYMFVANEEGVALRTGLLVDFLAEHHASTKQEMADYLATVHRSYNINDVSASLRQMLKAGIVERKAGAHSYQLTNNGRRIWKAAKVVWV